MQSNCEFNVVNKTKQSEIKIECIKYKALKSTCEATQRN